MCKRGRKQREGEKRRGRKYRREEKEYEKKGKRRKVGKRRLRQTLSLGTVFFFTFPHRYSFAGLARWKIQPS